MIKTASIGKGSLKVHKVERIFDLRFSIVDLIKIRKSQIANRKFLYCLLPVVSAEWRGRKAFAVEEIYTFGVISPRVPDCNGVS